MRVRLVGGAWGLALTLAWWQAAAAGAGVDIAWNDPLQRWWQLRQHLLYLSGVWSVGMLSLAMVLALRLPWLEAPLGGLDQMYRLHRWAGVTAAATAVLHWGAKESSGWIKATWGVAGRPARDAVWSGFSAWRSTGKDLGEWAFYALVVLVVLTLWQRLLPYKPWRWLHRVMPVVYAALLLHTVLLLPQSYVLQPLGALLALALLGGAIATGLSLLGRIGRGRRHVAEVEHAQVLGPVPGRDPLEVVCAMPPDWPGHRAGQFVYARWPGQEGAHPFTIASADGLQRADGRKLLRLVIKPLGDFTRQLPQQVSPGQTLTIEGPYGCFDGQGAAERDQVWVAGGIGITPFLAQLAARQNGAAPGAQHQPAQLHYCTRDAAHDAVLSQVQQLCAGAQPPVTLTVHDAAQGQYLQAEDLAPSGRALDIWLCGPQGLGQAVRAAAAAVRARHGGHWHVHQEAFQMR